MANPLNRVWSALSDASNAHADAILPDVVYSREFMKDWFAIDAAIDDVTRLVIARIEKDTQLQEGR